MPENEVVAIIAGTGMSKLLVPEDLRPVETPYGETYLGRLSISGKPVLIAPRHGPRHSVPPHKVNYRAMLHSVKAAGASAVIATSATGSMNKRMKPGDLAVPDQILDFTKSRPQTFFDAEGNLVFTDVTNPYSERVRKVLFRAAKRLGVRVHGKATYVCTEGPRFETTGEIKMFSKLGGDLVGMTGAPETFLARELGIEYATLSIVTNWAAGIAPRVSHEEVLEVMKRVGPVVRDIIVSAVRDISG